MPNIAPELCDMIIDFLHDERATLYSCSLVCRRWLMSSRFHLFYTIKIREDDSDIDAALAMLCGPKSTIPPHVRFLWIYTPSSLLASKVLLKLPLFPGVENLSLYLVTWPSLTLEARDCLLAFSCRLKSLRLDFTVFESFDQALELFSSAHSLEFLWLGGMICQTRGTPSAQFCAPSLKRITFHACDYIVPMIDWLQLSQPNPSVHTFMVTLLGVSDIPTICAYLRTLGPILQHLGIRCFGCPTVETQGMLRYQ